MVFILTNGAMSEALVRRNCLGNDVRSFCILCQVLTIYVTVCIIFKCWIYYLGGVGGSLRGRGWKYGSGFVDGVFPVMSPTAQKMLEFLQKEVDRNRIWEVLDTLPASHTIWDDIINVAVQLRLNKQWDLIILVRNQYLFVLNIPFVYVGLRRVLNPSYF